MYTCRYLAWRSALLGDDEEQRNEEDRLFAIEIPPPPCLINLHTNNQSHAIGRIHCARHCFCQEVFGDKFDVVNDLNERFNIHTVVLLIQDEPWIRISGSAHNSLPEYEKLGDAMLQLVSEKPFSNIMNRG